MYGLRESETAEALRATALFHALSVGPCAQPYRASRVTRYQSLRPVSIEQRENRAERTESSARVAAPRQSVRSRLPATSSGALLDYRAVDQGPPCRFVGVPRG